MTIYTKYRLQWIILIGLDPMLRLNRLTITPHIEKYIEDIFSKFNTGKHLIHQL